MLYYHQHHKYFLLASPKLLSRSIDQNRLEPNIERIDLPINSAPDGHREERRCANGTHSSGPSLPRRSRKRSKPPHRFLLQPRQRPTNRGESEVPPEQARSQSPERARVRTRREIRIRTIPEERLRTRPSGDGSSTRSLGLRA